MSPSVLLVLFLWRILMYQGTRRSTQKCLCGDGAFLYLDCGGYYTHTHTHTHTRVKTCGNWMRSTFYFLLFTYLFCFLGSYPQRMGSQARGWIRAAAASLGHSHSNTDLSCVCNPHHSSWQHQILNRLSKARYQTHVLLDTSQVCYHWVTTGTPLLEIF